MAVPSRMVLASLVALVAAGPAHAAAGEAPGVLKKQVTTPEQPAPVAVPAPAIGPAPKAETESTTEKSAPVTKGTIKKLSQTQTTAATAPTGSTTSTHAVRRSPARRTARKTTSRRHAARRHHAAAHPQTVPVHAGGRANAPGQQVASATSAAARSQERHARAKKPRRAAQRARDGAQAATDDDAPLATISRAADHVIQVIPGTVILGMAGLATLVLMLILRSLTVERQRAKALAKSYGVTVEALATAIEAKDHTTGGHIERVRRLGLLLARAIVPREAKDPQMAYGFLLHDIGKLAIPDAILRAPGRLTDGEWALMRKHPEEGERMLASVPFLDRALDVVRYHHERWDGGGYPDGLRGEEIPLWARIFAVVDALDAMTAERPYRAPRTYATALEEIRRHAGTQFDPAVVEALERLDPAEIEPLLEPTQLVEPLAELPAIEPLVAV